MTERTATRKEPVLTDAPAKGMFRSVMRPISKNLIRLTGNGITMLILAGDPRDYQHVLGPIIIISASVNAVDAIVTARRERRERLRTAPIEFAEHMYQLDQTSVLMGSLPEDTIVKLGLMSKARDHARDIATLGRVLKKEKVLVKGYRGLAKAYENDIRQLQISAIESIRQ